MAEQYDAIVVGSGACGGWASMELAQAGMRVLMLEAGSATFRNGMLELGILAFLIIALVVSLVLLRRRPEGSASAHRAID